MKGNREAIAETIENNVRSKIIKEGVNDPAFYEKMSELLGEVIKLRKTKAVEYEEYLKKIANLVAMVQVGKAEETPEKLNTPGKRALYNNLQAAISPIEGNAAADGHTPYCEDSEKTLELALKIDAAVKAARPDDWRGIQSREMLVKQAIYSVLPDINEVNRIFQIIFAQSEY